MPSKFRTLLDTILHRRVLRRWERMALSVDGLDAEKLRGLRFQGRQIRRQVDRVLHVAEGRLALPLIGSNAIRKPPNSDWSYRPEIWRGPLSPPGMAAVENKARIGEEATIFHDCRVSELTLRQIRNTREIDLAPFGLRLDVFRFDGSFLSLAINLPTDAAQSLRLKHLVRMAVVVDVEKPLELFARLNVKHGPNMEQIVRELPLGQEEVTVEFDLAYTKLNEKRVERMWVDLIFEGPEMNQIVLRDVTFSRRPRAEL